MSNVNFNIGGGLSIEHLEQLHETVLRVLDDVGVEVTNPVILKRITGQPGVRVQGTRVRLAAELVNRFVNEHRRSITPAAPGNDFFLEILSGYCFEVLDPATDRLRPMNTPDCIALAGLVDGLYAQGVRGGTPGLPQDVPAALREVLAYKISLEHTRSPGWPGISSLQTGEVAIRMAQATGQPIGLSIFVLDPLLVEGPTVDMAVEFLDRKAPIQLSISDMPMAGATAPIQLPGAFVESVATNLGAFTVFKLLGADIGITPLVFTFDMKYGTISMGNPEHVQAWLMADQLCAFYNNGQGHWLCPSFHTNAVRPDAHSMTTRASFAAIGALRGSRHFGFTGLLGIDKIFSPEQLILDIEIVRYLQHLVRPIEFTDATLGFDILKEVGPRGDFLMHPTTLEACRGLWNSPLFKNQSSEQAVAGTQATMKESIREIIRKAEAAHDFKLDPAVAKELDRIYRQYAATVT